MKRYLNSFFITLVLYFSFAGILFYIFANEDIIKKKSEKPKIISLNHIIIEPKVKPKIIPQVEKKIEKKVIKKEKTKLIKKPRTKVKKKKTKNNHKTKKIQKKKEIKKVEIFKKQEIAKKIVINEEKLYIDKHLVEIRNHILKNVKYPRRARKLSIEGVVKVKFKISKSGDVYDIKIISGHKLLQKATIKAITKAADDFPKTNKSIEIIIPIEYKLV